MIKKDFKGRDSFFSFKESYIAAIDTKTLKPGKKYLLKLGEAERIHSLAATEKDGK